MAKSKSGGTRTYIRGRVGSDVYSIGRDAKGKKQQVVRSLAESVANPQTQAQMKGRMIMSTIAQALTVLRPIVDHSFDGVSGARANLAEFTSQNYARIKNDIAQHPSSGNLYGLNKFQEKGAKRGAYVISNGQAALPAALVIDKTNGVVTITVDAQNITVAGLKAALGMTAEEYFTLVGLTAAGAANYERFRVNPALADDAQLSSVPLSNIFAVEGNAVATVALNSNVITITLAAVAGCCSVIISKKVAAGFIHNRAVGCDNHSALAESIGADQVNTVFQRAGHRPFPTEAMGTCQQNFCTLQGQHSGALREEMIPANMDAHLAEIGVENGQFGFQLAAIFHLTHGQMGLAVDVLDFTLAVDQQSRQPL